MEEPVPNNEQTRQERKSNLLKDEKELLLRIKLISRDIDQVQAELDKIYAAHRAIPRPPFSPQKPPIVQGSIIMDAVRARIEEEEKRKDQYHTIRTRLDQEIREDILETTQQIDRDIYAAGNGEDIIAATTPQKQPVPERQLRTDQGIWDANILAMGKRDSLTRIKEEFEGGLRLTRKKLKVMDEEMALDKVGESRKTDLEEEEGEDSCET